MLLTVAATAGAAGTNPRHSQSDVSYLVPQPVTGHAQIGAWLGRLTDTYRVDGMGNVMGRLINVNGAVDCAAVGAGPGTHCILNITWQDQYQVVNSPRGRSGVYNLPGGNAYLNPSMMLMGVDSAKAGLTFMLVDNKGLPEGGGGAIAGDRATLRAPCVNAPRLFLAMNPDTKFNGRRPDTCARIMHIDARPGSTVAHLVVNIEINGELATRFDMTLRRTPRGGAKSSR